MYEIVKSVITSRNFELNSILTKIDTLWIQGSITDDQKNELVTLARQFAVAGNEISIMDKIQELELRVRNLEGNKPSESIADFVVGKTYYKGDKVAFNGKTYVCVAPDGAVCVWSPSDYPAYWNEDSE